MRHVKCIFWVCIQLWRGITRDYKTQLSNVSVSKGFSEDQLKYMYRQIGVVGKPYTYFQTLYQDIAKLPGNEILNIDCNKGTITVENGEEIVDYEKTI